MERRKNVWLKLRGILENVAENDDNKNSNNNIDSNNKLLLLFLVINICMHLCLFYYYCFYNNLAKIWPATGHQNMNLTPTHIKVANIYFSNKLTYSFKGGK